MAEDAPNEIQIAHVGPFTFKRKMPFRMERTEEGIIISNAESDLTACGCTMEEAMRDLLSEIEMAWEEYAVEGDSGMDGIARGYKRWLLDNIDKRDRIRASRTENSSRPDGIMAHQPHEDEHPVRIAVDEPPSAPHVAIPHVAAVSERIADIEGCGKAVPASQDGYRLVDQRFVRSRRAHTPDVLPVPVRVRRPVYGFLRGVGESETMGIRPGVPPAVPLHGSKAPFERTGHAVLHAVLHVYHLLRSETEYPDAFQTGREPFLRRIA